MGRQQDFAALVRQVDPTHQTKSNYPIEYEFSNGRIFTGYYKNRGPYVPFAAYRTEDNRYLVSASGFFFSRPEGTPI